MMQELMRWDPFQELGTGLGLEGPRFAPAFDVRESESAYVFSADLPGLSEDDVEVSVTGSRLTISGQRSDEARDDSERLHLYERRYGAFSRSFSLPEGVDTDQVEARLDNGVLEVSVAKRPEVKPRRISLSSIKRAFNKA
jgi:HSP20 family protein